MVAERFSMGHSSMRKMTDVLDDSEQFPNREYTRLAVKPQGKFAILVFWLNGKLHWSKRVLSELRIKHLQKGL